ncbi:MAG: DNA-binding response regulator [Sulfurimonas sp.]|nr:MAG: DNA-binding response regulator [Sulfurimonas sp.]
MDSILLIEDDLDMQELIQDYLSNYDFEVVAFSKPKEAIEKFKDNLKNYSLVVLDLMLPQMDGFDVCKKLRQLSAIPIIISSARGEVSDKILAFEAGADDYLAKPYEPRELIIRINAILRRTTQQRVQKIGDISIDENKMEVQVDGYEVDLTQIEYDLLLFFLQNKNKILSRELILNTIKGIEYDARYRTIDMHISNLRQKIGDEAKNPKYIKSVWGIGYKFVGV